MILFYKIFIDPGKGIEPLQDDDQFSKQNIQGVQLVYMCSFVFDDIVQWFTFAMFLTYEYGSEKRKRLVVFVMDHEIVILLEFFKSHPVKSVDPPDVQYEPAQ